jgi:aspartyl-tRNA(Asn)/glutamyl-tRNA(Gln) amidotransferase subunit B
VYDSFIGLEIHIQLLTRSKVFCSCEAAFGGEPNTNVCPVCMGYPGVLPALNGQAVRMAYIVSRALSCNLSEYALFDRKNYFYPDMPKNYQISQFHSPVGTGGFVEFEYEGELKKIGIHDVHLEEDAGKMIHEEGVSQLDYNRAGTPLLEIVTNPDIVLGEEAEVFLQNFRKFVRYLGVCDGNMEEGSMRCDANVSVNLKGKGLGIKAEIKNLNSSRNVKLALNHEIKRHTEMLEKGERIVQETRLWDADRGCTFSMRTKEEANDYRYFPDPDLPPFRPDEEFLKDVEAAQVELPVYRRKRLVSDYSLTEAQADFLYEEKGRADFFEKTVNLGTDSKQAALWLAGDVKKILNRQNTDLSASPISPERLAGLISLIIDGEISGKIAKDVLEIIFEEDKDPQQIVDERGWQTLSDSSAIDAFVAEVLEQNDKVVQQIRGGAPKAVGFLVGQVMKKSAGKADPKIVGEILKNKIGMEYF